MSLFQRLFQNKKPATQQTSQSEEIRRLHTLDAFMTTLLGGDHFIAKSEYTDKLKEYSDLFNWFDVLQSSGTLEDYCRKNAISVPEISTILARCKNFSELIDAQNERYIKAKMLSEKSYLDNLSVTFYPGGRGM